MPTAVLKSWFKGVKYPSLVSKLPKFSLKDKAFFNLDNVLFLSLTLPPSSY